MVSIIVPTRNNEQVIEACLASLQRQTYDNIEVIVVDGNSTDQTLAIAKKYGARCYTFPRQGDHRSAQRNLGFAEATGAYLMYIDSDMVLEPEVVAQCVQLCQVHKDLGAVTIHEDSIGRGYWARCKAMERMCYQEDTLIEGVRFFPAEVIVQCGGFNEQLIAAEDWDLAERIKAAGHRIATIDARIIHDEGDVHFWKLLKKKAYYGSHMPQFVRAQTTTKKQHGLWYAVRRIYFFRASLWRQWRAFLRQPHIACGMFALLLGETVAGGCGYLYGRLKYVT